jgi:hypothetical protein
VNSFIGSSEMVLRWRQCLGLMAGTFIVLSIATLVLTVAVDPYRMYGSPTLRGLTALKPRAYERSDFVKEYLIERLKPRTLLLGNSRVEIALDPDSDIWPQDTQPVFNAAESGHDLATALVRFRHAIQVAPLRLAILAVDFPDFLERGEPAPGLDETRLPFDRNGHPNPERKMRIWKDRLTTTLTIDALVDSVMTVLNQNESGSATMTESGFNPLHDYEVIARRNGYHWLFAQKYNAYRTQYGKAPKPNFDIPTRNANFRYLDEIIKLAVAHNVHLIVYVHPYHYTFLELLHNLDLWPSFEAWKRALLATIDGAAGPQRGLITILDFSGYSPIAMEPIPGENDRQTTMRWYWESGHYKSTLGNILIARIVNKNENFGRELTNTTVESVLDEINAGRRALAAPP